MNDRTLIQDFQRDVSAGYSDSMMSELLRHLERFTRFFSKPILSAKRNDVKQWLYSLEGLSPSTLAKHRRSLTIFFNYCQGENMVVSNPTRGITMPKITRRDPPYLEHRELLKIKEVTKENLRDSAIIETLYSTGVRASEFINIKIEDIDFAENTIWVLGKGKKERFVYFTPECSEKIERYLRSRKDNCPFLFVTQYKKPFKRNSLTNLIRWYSRKTDIGKPVYSHIFRHTLAVHLAERGASLQFIGTLLGHVDFETTKRYYAHLTLKARKNKYDRNF